jgi:hypothetical protein
MRQPFFPVACSFGAAALLFMSSAFAQVGAPQLGWVPDGTRIRPVYGIPAAAAVGAPIPANHDFSHIAASAERNYVLVSAADTGAVSVYTSARGLVDLDGASSFPDSMVLSPGGSSAALWFSALNQIQVVTGLPDVPSMRRLDVSFLESAPGALAISDDGAWVAGTWTSGAYAFGPSGVNRIPVEGASALTFFHGKHDVASAGAAGVQMITGIEGFAVASTLLPAADASQPGVIGIAATSDNKTLVLADQSGSLTVIDIASAAATVSNCGCQPAGLFGIGPSAFRLTALDGGSFKLIDASSGEILFAPLALTETEGAGQ